MEYGIQRRGIYLVPPTEDDLLWFCAQFDLPEVYDMFGFDGPSSLRMMREYRNGAPVVGILHRISDRKRIGFVIMFPPDDKRDYWEFGYAIPELADRDAFSALNSTDAMAHYMFDHLRVDAMGWRTRADNRAADAVVRRLGYVPTETFEVKGLEYTFYRLDRPGWERRKAKLERGEAARGGPSGDLFVTLSDPPFDPVPPAEPATADPPASPATAAPPAPRRRKRR